MNFLGPSSQLNPIIISLILLWSLFWKGAALWRAAKYEQKKWFVALLILNTLGIFEIIFLFRFAKKRLTFEELRSWNPWRR